MNSLKKIKKAVAWQSFEVFSQFLLQLVYFSVMARLLLKEDYGLMAIANGVIGIGAIFIQGGMGTALVQKKEVTNNHVNGALQVSFLISIFLYLASFFASESVSEFYESPELSPIIKVVAANFILLALSNIPLNLLHRNFQFKKSSSVTIAAMCAGYALGVILGVNGYGVWSLIWATLFMSFIKMIGYFYFAPFKISLFFHFKEAKELFGFGSGMMLLALSNFFSQNGLNLILGRIFPSTVLGVFERGSNLKGLPSQILGKVIDKVMFPFMAELQDEDDKLVNVFKFGLGLSNSLMIPSAVFLVFFTPEIVQLLMGQKWQDVIVPLQIMFMIIPFSNSGRMADSIIRAKGLIYKNVKRKYVFTFILIVLSSGLAHQYGINGAAVGIVVSYIINYFMMIVLIKKIFPLQALHLFWRPFFQGCKLSFYLGLLIVLYKEAFSLWGVINVVGFLVFSGSLLVCLFFIARYTPSFLGEYIAVAIREVRKK